jgi:hypothetical protein
MCPLGDENGAGGVIFFVLSFKFFCFATKEERQEAFENSFFLLTQNLNFS